MVQSIKWYNLLGNFQQIFYIAFSTFEIKGEIKFPQDLLRMGMPNGKNKWSK